MNFKILLVVAILFFSCSERYDSDSLSDEEFINAQKIITLLEKSQINLSRGNYQSSITFVDSALSIDKNLIYPVFVKGMIYEDLNQFDVADSLYKRVLKKVPNFRSANFNLGNIALAKGEYSNAVKYYKNEEKNYSTPDVLTKLGVAYANIYEIDSALVVLQKSISIDSLASEAFMLIGKIYRDNGDIKKAKNFMSKALSIEPNNWDYQLNYGTLLFKMGDLNESLSYLKNVVKVNKWHYASHYNLGQLLSRLGKKDEANKYLSRADTLQQANTRIGFFQENLKSNPENISDWLNMGIALQSIENFSEAYEVFKIVDHLDSNNLDLKQNLAFLAISNEDTISSIKYYQSILSNDNSKSDIWFNLGLIYAYQGKFNNASRCWKKTIELNPDDKTAIKYLESLSKIEQLPFYDLN